MKRTTLAKLSEIDTLLTDRDKVLLETFRKLRYIKTDQVQRLFYPKVIDRPYAAQRATSRHLVRLQNLGLVTHLQQRIGGVRAGAQGKIWHLTEDGARLLDLGTDDQDKRKRTLEPSQMFLRHTIAITECFVQITEICRKEPSLRLDRIELEPECWRSYEVNRKAISLRPDLYVKTISGEYFDHMFIEMDLATEGMLAIIEKCRRYHEYYASGKEQHAVGVFPLVLWIVPTEERQQRMIDGIKEAFGNRRAHIFLVITPEELRRVLRDGAQENELC